MGFKNVWFTSDLHLGHSKIIEYCNRPFSSVFEMDQALIKNWNDRISPKDDVYILGDFMFYGYKKAAGILRKLKGNKFLIVGNHDKNVKNEYESEFIWVKTRHMIGVRESDVYMDIKEKEFSQLIVLDHYPLLTWEKKHFGAWHLHGHTHNKVPREESTSVKRIDIGVDAWNYCPVSYDQLKTLIMGESEKEIVKVDYNDEYWIEENKRRDILRRIKETERDRSEPYYYEKESFTYGED